MNTKTKSSYEVVAAAWDPIVDAWLEVFSGPLLPNEERVQYTNPKNGDVGTSTPRLVALWEAKEAALEALFEEHGWTEDEFENELNSRVA